MPQHESSLLAAGIGYQNCTDVIATRARDVLLRAMLRDLSAFRKPGRCSPGWKADMAIL